MPVILFSPMLTGHHFGGTGTAAGGNGIPPMEFGLGMVCTTATQVTVNIWPTGGNTINNQASIGFNAAATTPLTLNLIGTGPGRTANIPLQGNNNQRNVLNVTATDSAGVSTTGTVTYYLRAAMTIRKPRKTGKKSKGGRK